MAVTQSDHKGSSDRIMFGKLEDFTPTETPVIVSTPGPEFQDDVRPGAMIIGMDRTPKAGYGDAGRGPAISLMDTSFLLQAIMEVRNGRSRD